MNDKGQTVVHAADMEWTPIDEIWEGCSIKILYQNPVTGFLVALFKFEPDARQGVHTHPSVGHGFIVEGEYVIGDEVCGPGTYVRAPARIPHGAGAKAGPEGYVALGWYPEGSGLFERYIPDED